MIKVFGKIYRAVFRQLWVSMTAIAVFAVYAVAWSLFIDPGQLGNDPGQLGNSESTGWGGVALNTDYDRAAGVWSPIGVANACGLGASSCFKCHNGRRAKKWSEDPETTPWHPNHKKVNFSCAGCHKGNPRLLKKSLAHAKLIADPRLAPDRCKTCHTSGKAVDELLKAYQKPKQKP